MTPVTCSLQILWTAISRVLIGEIIRSDAVQALSSSQPLHLFDPYAPSSSSSPSQSQPQTQFRPTYAAVLTGTAPTASAGPSTARPPQRDAVRAMLDRVLGAMNRFRDASPLMGMIHDGFVSLTAAMN